MSRSTKKHGKCENIEDLKIYIKRFIVSSVPGCVNTLDNYTINIYGLPFIDIFFDDPVKAYEILLKFYQDEFTAEFILKTLFIRPLTHRYANTLFGEELFSVIVNKDSQKARKLISRLICS